MENIFHLIIFFEFLSALIGTIFLKKVRGTILQYFVILLWLVFMVEMAMSYLKLVDFYNNAIVYSILSFIQFCFFFILYFKAINNAHFKSICKAFLILFILSSIINFLYLQDITATSLFHSYTYLLGSFFLGFAITLYFIEILRSEQILFFKRNILFYISTGLFLFHVGSIPYFLAIQLNPNVLMNRALAFAFMILCVFMYCCFIVGFSISNRYISN